MNEIYEPLGASRPPGEVALTASGAEVSPSWRHAHFGYRFVTPLALGSTLNPINSTMISTALVPIANDYHASVAETGWLIAGLYLVNRPAPAVPVPIDPLLNVTKT